MAANIVSNENESNHEYHSVPLENKVQDNSSKLPHSSSTSQITGMDSSPTPVVPQHQMSESKTPPPQNHRRIFKIIVIGDSNVGKTCLTFRFCGGKFLQRSEATIGVDFREKTIQIDDETIKLQIWDTAGQERFRKSMISHYYRNVHAVLFVYDVTNLGSFENLTYWIEEFNRHCSTLPSFNQIPRILVGNKCDLASDSKVNTNMAQTFADMHQMPLFETSAKDDSRQDHVEAIFMTLALKLKNSKPFYVPSQLHKARIESIDHDGNTSVHRINEQNNNKSSDSCYC